MLFLLAAACAIGHAHEPVYPPGNITIQVTIDSNSTCTSRPMYSYAVDSWRNGVVGPDSTYAMYGYDDLHNDIFNDTGHHWGTTLREGVFAVGGAKPLVYICAFSPSEGSDPPIFKDWHMCGCCFQFNSFNATNFAGYCEDSSGMPCQTLCSVTTAGDPGNRQYTVHVHTQPSTA